MTKDTHMSVREAATELGINRQAVLARIHSGTLKAFKIGGVYAVERESVARLKEARRQMASLKDDHTGE